MTYTNGFDVNGIIRLPASFATTPEKIYTAICERERMFVKSGQTAEKVARASAIKYKLHLA